MPQSTARGVDGVAWPSLVFFLSICHRIVLLKDAEAAAKEKNKAQAAVGEREGKGMREAACKVVSKKCQPERSKFSLVV